MEFVSVGLYKEHLVRYSVVSYDGVHFTATFLRYKGNSTALPPKKVLLQCQGNRWKSDADKELMTFLVNDIDSRLRKEMNRQKQRAKSTLPLAHNLFASAIHEITYRRH